MILCVEVCSVLAGEERNLREDWSVGEQCQGVWTLHHSQPHPQGTNILWRVYYLHLHPHGNEHNRRKVLSACLCVQCGNQTCALQHYWYTSWPDHKTPDSTMPLLQLMSDVETDRRTSAAAGPVIVHCRYRGDNKREKRLFFCKNVLEWLHYACSFACSAGIGRTGCFIATTIGCRQLQMEGVVDVLSITCQLRADR